MFLLAGGVLLGHRPAQVNGDAIPVFRLQLGLEGCFLPDLPVVVLAAGRDGHGPAPGQKSLFKRFLDQFLHGVVAVLPFQVQAVQQRLAVSIESPQVQHAVRFADRKLHIGIDLDAQRPIRDKVGLPVPEEA